MNKLEVIEILKDMNIVDEYLALSKNHQVPINELFKKYENQRVIEIIESFGLKSTYNKSENFFKVNYPSYSKVRFQINLDLKSGMVNIIWCVWWDNEILIGIPMSMLVREITDNELKTIRPLFRNYDEFQIILSKVFGLFDDFMQRFIARIDKGFDLLKSFSN